MTDRTFADGTAAGTVRTRINGAIGNVDTLLDAGVVSAASAVASIGASWTPASASGPAALIFGEDTDNGANTVSVQAPASVSANAVVTLPGVTATLAVLGANTFTGTQNFGGQQVEAHLNKVVTSVSGTLTTAAHSGNVLVTSGNVTVPTTAGFNCILIAGGAHTVTFNSTTSAAMASGDVMTVVVQSSTVIHAVLTAAAGKVSFT